MTAVHLEDPRALAWQWMTTIRIPLTEARLAALAPWMTGRTGDLATRRAWDGLAHRHRLAGGPPPTPEAVMAAVEAQRQREQAGKVHPLTRAEWRAAFDRKAETDGAKWVASGRAYRKKHRESPTLSDMADRMGVRFRDAMVRAGWLVQGEVLRSVALDQPAALEGSGRRHCGSCPTPGNPGAKGTRLPAFLAGPAAVAVPGGRALRPTTVMLGPPWAGRESPG